MSSRGGTAEVDGQSADGARAPAQPSRLPGVPSRDDPELGPAGIADGREPAGAVVAGRRDDLAAVARNEGERVLDPVDPDPQQRPNVQPAAGRSAIARSGRCSKPAAPGSARHRRARNRKRPSAPRRGPAAEVGGLPVFREARPASLGVPAAALSESSSGAGWTVAETVSRPGDGVDSDAAVADRRIELLFWEGCPSNPEALELLRECARRARDRRRDRGPRGAHRRRGGAAPLPRLADDPRRRAATSTREARGPAGAQLPYLLSARRAGVARPEPPTTGGSPEMSTALAGRATFVRPPRRRRRRALARRATATPTCSSSCSPATTARTCSRGRAG